MRLLICGVVMVMVAACGKHVTKEMLGPTATPPGVLAKITPGMTLDDVKAIAPDAKDDDRGLRVGKVGPIDLYVEMRRGGVYETSMEYPGDGSELLEAWGKSDTAPDPEDSTVTHVWRAHGWRASLYCRAAKNQTCTVHFKPYKPLEEMFTANVRPIGRMAHAKQDMSLEDLRKATSSPHLERDSSTAETEFEQVTEYLYIDDNKLATLNYFVPAEVLPLAKKAWGPGKTTGDATMWCDATTSWCASIDGKKNHLDLKYYGFMPFEREIAALDDMSGMSTVEQAIKAHPELGWDTHGGKATPIFSIHEYMTPLEATNRRMVVAVNVVPAGLHFEILNVGNPEELLPVLTKRWGEPTKATAADGTSYTWAKHGMLRALTDTPDGTLHNAAYLIVSRE